MLTAEEISVLCTAGGMAPSGGNAQPWRVRVGGDRMSVRATEGEGSFLDVGGYAARFAVGCFAENVAGAAGALGLDHKVSISDDGVEFTFTGRLSPVPDEKHGSIAERVTNRGPSDGTTLSEHELASIVDNSGAVAISDGKQAIAAALGAADVLRMRHPVMFADMVREICWTDREAALRREGLDLQTLELPGATVKLLSLLRRMPALRKLLPAGPLADTARQVVANSSHMCCLSVAGPLTDEAMVAAGMRMQRLWLTATAHGVWVHPWTVSTLLLARLEVFGGDGLSEREREEVARIGRGLRQGFGLGPQDHPVFVFRLFTGPPPAVRSLRLPWQSFTTIDKGVGDGR